MIHETQTCDEPVLLWDYWWANWQRQPDAPAFVHWTLAEGGRTICWNDLVADAWRYARRLLAADVRPGQVCALMLRHRPEFYPLYLAVSLVGAIPSVLAYPNPRLHPDKFRQGLEGMARCSGLDLLLTERDLEPIVRPLVEGDQSSIGNVLFPLDWSGDLAREPFDADDLQRLLSAKRERVSPDAPCLLQHSSGTTGLQKGVMLSHRAVRTHLRAYGQAVGIQASDRVASWLPLYHDMGLIAAFHLPLHFGLPIVQIDPFEWVSAPVLLLQAIAQERATLTWLPNFAYNLMADRIHEEDLAGVRLDTLRLAVNCSEPVLQGSHEKFLQRYGDYGLSATALSACYAMAETTFAVTQTAPGETPRVAHADRQELGRGRYQPAPAGAGARPCVSSGRPIAGCRLRVVDAEGREVPDGEVGTLLIASDSLFSGYRNNPVKTAEALCDGWYRSGDLGFVLDGECYVVGREKDLIIVAGKNLYPEDIESAVSAVAGVLPGRVVAYGQVNPQLGTEEICIIAETAETDQKRARSLELAIKQAGMAIGVTISRVALVPPRWLFKSSAGKPMRKANQERLHEASRAAA